MCEDHLCAFMLNLNQTPRWFLSLDIWAMLFWLVFLVVVVVFFVCFLCVLCVCRYRYGCQRNEGKILRFFEYFEHVIISHIISCVMCFVWIENSRNLISVRKKTWKLRVSDDIHVGESNCKLFIYIYFNRCRWFDVIKTQIRHFQRQTIKCSAILIM